MPKKFVRKSKKQYPMVRFTLPEIYGDAEFELPKINALTLERQGAIQEGRLIAIVDALSDDDVNVDEETIEAVRTLRGEDEIGSFVEAWAKASPVSAGKSEA